MSSQSVLKVLEKVEGYDDLPPIMQSALTSLNAADDIREFFEGYRRGMMRVGHSRVTKYTPDSIPRTSEEIARTESSRDLNRSLALIEDDGKFRETRERWYDALGANTNPTEHSNGHSLVDLSVPSPGLIRERRLRKKI